MKYLAARYLDFRYFARRAGQAPPPPPALPDDLLGAFKATFWGSPELVAAAPGGIYLDEAPRKTPAGPYIVAEEGSATLTLWTTTSQVHDTPIKLRVYANDTDTSGRIGDLVEAAFKGRPLVFRQGFSGPLVRRGRQHQKAPWWAKDNTDAWSLTIEFQCRVKRD